MIENLFSKYDAQDAQFSQMVKEKNLAHVADNLSTYEKNSLVGLYSDLQNDEKVDSIIMDELGETHSVFAKIVNAKDNTHRFRHCGGSSIQTLAEDLHKQIETFFNEFYK